jgi:hypothetical protein
MTARRRTVAGGIAVAVALLLAGCGRGPGGAGPAAGHPVPALATAMSGGTGTSWAVLELGGPAARHDNFWELFVRPAGSARWQLATPPGVASNGGLVVARAGASGLMTSFRPSQDLTFSPLAATTDSGRTWAQASVLDAGVADLPGALAAGAGGRLLAVTGTGTIEQSADAGARWTRLAGRPTLARTAAVGDGCTLTAVTAVAWAADGRPLAGGRCAAGGHGVAGHGARPRRAGLLADVAGSWRLTGPVLPARLGPGPVSVLDLASSDGRTTAILAAGPGSIVAAWSADGGVSWTVSPALRASGGGQPSVSISADGSAGLVLGSGRAATIGWQGAGWRVLPPVPARTAALAQSPAGLPQALAPDGGTLTVWQLAGRPGAAAWVPQQTVHVAIPYGSSG